MVTLLMTSQGENVLPTLATTTGEIKYPLSDLCNCCDGPDPQVTDKIRKVLQQWQECLKHQQKVSLSCEHDSSGYVKVTAHSYRALQGYSMGAERETEQNLSYSDNVYSLSVIQNGVEGPIELCINPKGIAGCSIRVEYDSKKEQIHASMQRFWYELL